MKDGESGVSCLCPPGGEVSNEASLKISGIAPRSEESCLLDKPPL